METIDILQTLRNRKYWYFKRRHYWIGTIDIWKDITKWKLLIFYRLYEIETIDILKGDITK